jgi:hypothetical protein
MPAVTNGRLPPSLPKRGVYLFTERGRHLYVGRSNNIPKRYDAHRYGGSNSSPFALKLAREMTGKLVASYKPGKDSVDGLMKDPEFIAAFNEAKARIRRMEFRFVGEEDQMRQMLAGDLLHRRTRHPLQRFFNPLRALCGVEERRERHAASHGGAGAAEEAR